MVSITSLSTICVDIFNDTGELCPGGEALNFAAIASGYPHIDMSIIAAIGDDEGGQKAIKSISNKPIRKDCIHIIAGGKTASNRIYLTDAGDRYFKHDSWDGGVYQNYQLCDADYAKLAGADIVFLNYECPLLSDIVAFKQQATYKLAVDFDVMRDLESIRGLLPSIDFFFISGDDHILSTLKDWSSAYGCIFNITLAERGSATYHAGQAYSVAAVPVAQVVDTTGCGDSYHAGFIGSYVQDGDILSAMREGSRVASVTLGHKGGFVY